MKGNKLGVIKNDMDALEAFREVLVGGGRLIVLVPAFNFLFGSMDRADGHYRRYSRGELLWKLTECGFHVQLIRWINLLGILGWFLNGKVFYRTFIPESTYAAYDRMVPLLRLVESLVPMPIGLSLLCIGQKPTIL